MANLAENTPEAVLPSKKQFLASEVLHEIWDERGMKYRFDELHLILLQNGLGPYIDRQKFRSMVYNILEQFLVRGEAKRDPRYQPLPRFPRVL